MLMAAAMAVGCTNPREDVRITLCKDMVAVELGTVPSWQGSGVQIRGDEGAVVTVYFGGAGGDQQAACYYHRVAVDDTAVTLANPIEAYATSPAEVVLNGRTLSGPELARAVQRAMQKQGREFVDRARETLRGQ
jgi:hypothetical protein